VKQDFSQIPDADCSCLQIEVLVDESWIDRFLNKQNLSIPISEQYHLTNLRIDLGDGKLELEADIMEKEGTSVRVTCLPRWDASLQRIFLEELELKTLGKNVLLKSAGWFAKTFMGARIDKKIEEASNKLYAHQMALMLADGLSIPFPGGGSAKVQVRSVTITQMTFVDHSIKVKAMIDGYWKLHLAEETA
jgi:Domain of unknown function (DUF4403)